MLKVELKKIKLLKSLSEETPAYTADLYVDGELIAHLSNHGHGGCDYCHAPKGKDMNWCNDKYLKADAEVKATFPKHTYKAGNEVHTMDESLEVLCHGLVWDDDLVKTVKRDLSKKVMFTKTDGKIYQITAGKDAVRLIAIVKAKPDTAKVLNELSIDEAVAIYKAQ